MTTERRLAMHVTPRKPGIVHVSRGNPWHASGPLIHEQFRCSIRNRRLLEHRLLSWGFSEARCNRVLSHLRPVRRSRVAR